MIGSCPQCSSPITRAGQRYCHRCGKDLKPQYEELGLQPPPSGDLPEKPNLEAQVRTPDPPKPPSDQSEPDPPDFETTPAQEITAEVALANQDSTIQAMVRVLLPTGDVFDREITQAETKVGKGPKNDIVLADQSVSSTHALIRFEKGQFIISDLGSRNGTIVNGERVTGSRIVQHGDVIGLGLSKLTFRVQDRGDTGYIKVEEAPAPSISPAPLTETSLLQALTAEGRISTEEIESLRTKGKRLYCSLVEDRGFDEYFLRDLVKRTFGLPVVELSAKSVAPELAARFPPQMARDHQMFPISESSGRLRLAIADPTDQEAVEQVKRLTGLEVDLEVATLTEIRNMTAEFFGERLIGVVPSGEKLEYRLSKNDVEIGKAGHNHIILNDPTVSNTHAVILHRDGVRSVVDLGSRNGTFVNGTRLSMHVHPLRHGDVIQVGQTVLTFRNLLETNENTTAVLSSEALPEAQRSIQGAPDLPAQIQASSGPMPSSVQSAPAGGIKVPLTAGAEVAAGNTEEGDKKKKKKKKKDDRMRAAYVGAASRILAQVVALMMGVALSIYLLRPSSSPSPPPPATTGEQPASAFSGPRETIAFQGGTYEASGVVQVPGTNGVLFVDDGRPDQVLWMRVDENGRQVGPIRPVPLGSRVDDPEGITYGGGFFYVAGSQSDPGEGTRNAMLRFVFDSENQVVIGEPEVITDLRSFLLSNLPDLAEEGRKHGDRGGLNIEGIAWDPVDNRLLLGLRSPMSNDHAILIPLRLKDPRGAFTVDNLKIAESGILRIPLGGLGVRDIHYDSYTRSFLLIGGAAQDQARSDFKLFEWSGKADASGSNQVKEHLSVDARIKPEGLTHMQIGSRDFLFVVGDNNNYSIFDYPRQ